MTFGDVVYAPLHDLVGGAVARDLCFTGRTVEAREALALHLVTKIVAPAYFSDATVEVAAQIARAARSADEDEGQGRSFAAGYSQSSTEPATWTSTAPADPPMIDRTATRRHPVRVRRLGLWVLAAVVLGLLVVNTAYFAYLRWEKSEASKTSTLTCELPGQDSTYTPAEWRWARRLGRLGRLGRPARPPDPPSDGADRLRVGSGCGVTAGNTTEGAGGSGRT